MENNKLQKAIIKARKVKNQTYQEMADGIGMSKTQAWELCNKKCNPTYSVLKRIAKHFDFNADDLMSILK